MIPRDGCRYASCVFDNGVAAFATSPVAAGCRRRSECLETGEC